MSLLTFSIADMMSSNLGKNSVFMVLIAASIVVKEVLDSSLAVVVSPSSCFWRLALGAGRVLAVGLTLASMVSLLAVSLALAVEMCS